MNKDLLEFKEKYSDILRKYKIDEIVWSQFIPYDDSDIIFEININSINGRSSINEDIIVKLAWEEFFKLITKYKSSFLAKQFGNNVQVTISLDNITVEECEPIF